MRVYKPVLMRLSAHRARFLDPFYRRKSAYARRNVKVMVVVVVVVVVWSNAGKRLLTVRYTFTCAWTNA